MSIALINSAWKLAMPATRKMVLLAMCDWANDAGTSCHPSIKALAMRASISERQAKRVMHDLIEGGWISVIGNEFGGAPGQTRHYRINVKAIETGDMGVTGDNLSRVTNEAAGRVTSATRRVTSTTETGDMGVTQSTIDPPIKASISEASTKTRATALTVNIPDWLDRDDWAQWVDHRKTIRKPMTARAAELSIGQLDGLRAEGFTPKQVIENAIVCGWQGLYAPKTSPVGGPLRALPNKQQQLEDRNRRVADGWVAKQSAAAQQRLT